MALICGISGVAPSFKVVKPSSSHTKPFTSFKLTYPALVKSPVLFFTSKSPLCSKSVPKRFLTCKSQANPGGIERIASISSVCIALITVNFHCTLTDGQFLYLINYCFDLLHTGNDYQELNVYEFNERDRGSPAYLRLSNKPVNSLGDLVIFSNKASSLPLLVFFCQRK